MKVSRNAPEVDFIIIHDKVVVFMQVKGGHYCIVVGDWHLETDEGLEFVRDPMKLTWDSAMAVRDYLKEKIGREVFVLSVFLLPDMQPDPDIELLADRDRTAVMYGVEDLVERLLDLAEERDVYDTPSPHIAERIVNALMPQIKFGFSRYFSQNGRVLYPLMRSFRLMRIRATSGPAALPGRFLPALNNSRSTLITDTSLMMNRMNSFTGSTSLRVV